MSEHTFIQTCAYFTAAHYMRAVEKIANKIYAPTGMSPAYSYIMMALEDHDGVSISDLARYLGYERTSLSRMIKQLKNKGLVRLKTIGRKNLIFLSENSDDFLKTANACANKLSTVTNQILGDNKPKMTKLLVENTKKLEEQNNDKI